MTKTRYTNGARHEKINLMPKKCHVMEVQWDPHELGQNMTSIQKEDKYLGVIIQNNLSPENIYIKYLVTHSGC